MNSPLVITPFEEQVLQAVHASVDMYQTSSIYTVQHMGRELFGPAWGGMSYYTDSGILVIPTIARFLGRLAKKELVQRASIKQALGRKSGLWTLTTLGKELLGID